MKKHLKTQIKLLKSESSLRFGMILNEIEWTFNSNSSSIRVKSTPNINNLEKHLAEFGDNKEFCCLRPGATRDVHLKVIVILDYIFMFETNQNTQLVFTYFI